MSEAPEAFDADVRCNMTERKAPERQIASRSGPVSYLHG